MLKKKSQGFSIVAVIIVLVVVAAISLGGWYVWQNRDKKQSNNNYPVDNASSQAPKDSGDTLSPVDPTEGGKYVFVEEWGLRIPLPISMKGKVTYSMGELFPDPDGNNIQGMDIFVTTGALTGDNFCATKDSSMGAVIDSGAQYIRSERAKPFDSSRYRGTFKENILTDNQYNYHLNYVTPDCVGSEENANKIEELHAALMRLEKN